MSFTTTTLSGAVAAGDKTIGVASTTGFTAGRFVLVDNEMMQIVSTPASGVTVVPVLRGQQGTAAVAHVTSANATVGDGTDFASPVAGVATTTYASYRPRLVTSYSAAGAITLPTGGADAVAIVNGTSALAMTVAVPTKDMDGCLLYIASNGKANHTVNFGSTNGLGGNTTNSDVVTFNSSQSQAFVVMAANGFWVNVGLVAGAATVAGPGLA